MSYADELAWRVEKINEILAEYPQTDIPRLTGILECDANAVRYAAGQAGWRWDAADSMWIPAPVVDGWWRAKLAGAFEAIIEQLPGTSPEALFFQAADLIPEAIAEDPGLDLVVEIRKAIEGFTPYRWTGYRNGAGQESLAQGEWADSGL